MNLHFKGTLAKEEYVDIITLLSKPVKAGPRATIARWIPSIIIMILGLIVGVGTLLYGVTRGDAIVMLMALVTVVLAVLIPSFMLRRKRISPAAEAELIWRIEANRKLVFEGTVTDNGIEMKAPAGETFLRWQGFVGYGEYKDIMVLVQQAKAFLSIPKRFFDREEEWTAFRDLVSRRLTVTHRVDNHANGAVGGQ